MTLRTWLVFLLAIASGVSAILGVSQMRSSQLAREMTSVVVVKKNIGRGYQIQDEHVEVRQIPAEFAHKSMPKSIEEVVGRVATTTLFEGEYVMSNKVASPGSKAGFATLVPAGYRAYSIPAVSAANRVSGLLNVGDRVDVLLSRAAGGNNGRAEVGVVETLLQNVEVLAVDKVEDPDASRTAAKTQSNSKSESSSSTVTLVVTPKQAAVLGLGQKEGTLSLSLRNPEDQVITESGEITESQLTDSTEVNATAQVPETNLTNEPTVEELLVDSDEDQSMTVEEMQALLASFAETNKPSPKFTAIRTIRGSRMGVVPVRTKGK